jgi:hypothetical protein
LNPAVPAIAELPDDLADGKIEYARVLLIAHGEI